MRILHVLDAAVAGPTDYGRRARALLAELRTQGVHTIHVAGPDPRRRPRDAPMPAAAMPAPAVPDHWPHHDWHLYRARAPGRPAWLPGACDAALTFGALALRLHRVARLTRPDLIHVHAPGRHAAAAWPVARLARVPLLVEVERRTGQACSARALDRLVCARADAVATASVDMRAALRLAGLRPRRFAILPAAADVPAAVCVDRGPPGLENAPLLAYAGPLERVDGIDLLLAAVGALRRRHPTLRLLVAGGGARTDALQARLAGSSLRGHVVFTGQLPGRRAADALARADIAVFPALSGSGAALAPSRHFLNAMAQGCAVVASDLAGQRDLLVHGHSGMLFPAGDAGALVALLGRLLAERWRLAPLGRAAAAAIAGQRDWSAAAGRYRRLYASLIAPAAR